MQNNHRRIPRMIGSVLAAVAVLAAMPARAEPMSAAEKLRRLDLMLMVTGLRCRATTDDFQADFQSFEANHLPELNMAEQQLRAEMVAAFGKTGAEGKLDRLSVAIANAYGNGHPWLGCPQLKAAAQNLAKAQGVAPLLEAADAMLFGDELAQANNGPPQKPKDAK